MNDDVFQDSGNCQAVVEIIDGIPYTCPNIAREQLKTCIAHHRVQVNNLKPQAIQKNLRRLMSDV